MEGGNINFPSNQSPSPKSMAPENLRRRPRLLHACAASFLTIVHNAYRRAEDLENPIGSFARSFASLATHVVQPLQNQCLSLISFFDNAILTVEDIAVAVFPPSEIAFAAVDQIAFFAESLPEIADKAFDEMLLLTGMLPLVEPTAGKLVASPVAAELQTVTSNDNICDEKINGVCSVLKEEEGVVKDNEENCDERVEKVAAEEAAEENQWRAMKAEEDVREVEKTCNEILSALEKMDVEVEEEQQPKKDPILSLFDEGWQAKPL